MQHCWTVLRKHRQKVRESYQLGAIFLCICDIYCYRYRRYNMKNNITIKEDITKAEVQRMIDSSIDSNDTKKYIKTICDDVLENMFKVLWQRKGFWKH